MEALIATHGRPDLLENTLAALLAATDRGLLQKVILVENGGDCGAKQIVEKLDPKGFIAFHSVAEGNKSNALNHGLVSCAEGLIFMTDDDVEISLDTLQVYREIEASNLGKNYFGGPTKAIHESPIPEYLSKFLPRSASGWTSAQEKVDRNDHFLGFNWAARKTDLIDAGGFNPDFGPGSKTGATGQESDMQRRLKRIGARPLYLPDAVVSHSVPAERCSADWLLSRSYRQGVESGLQTTPDKIDEARAYWKNSSRRLLAKAMLLKFTANREAKFKNAFYRQRFKGFGHGYTLVVEGRISKSPHFQFAEIH